MTFMLDSNKAIPAVFFSSVFFTVLSISTLDNGLYSYPPCVTSFATAAVLIPKTNFRLRCQRLYARPSKRRIIFMSCLFPGITRTSSEMPEIPKAPSLKLFVTKRACVLGHECST